MLGCAEGLSRRRLLSEPGPLVGPACTGAVSRGSMPGGWPQRCAGRRVVGGGGAGGATAACGRGADAGRAGRLRAGAACSGSSTTCGNAASARGTGVDCRREVGGGAGAGGSGDAGGTGEGTGCGGVSPMKSTRVTLPADAP